MSLSKMTLSSLNVNYYSKTTVFDTWQSKIIIYYLMTV